ncbi:uncharacterized protein LOC144172976 [Haemaphysalis longicornis]
MMLVVNALCYVVPWLSFCVRTPPVISVIDYFHVPVDGFEAMGRLPELLAAYSSTNCSSYMCLNASLTRYDTKTKHLSYLWNFVGLENKMTRTSLFDVQYDSSLDTPWFNIDGDSCHNYTGHVSYSDYRTCLVGVLPYYQDTLCMLWITKSVVQNIPKVCMDAFRATCGEGYPDFSQELCQYA